ncbi:chromosome (plasmid) partitioning protein ParB [Lachnospiraceae bacterium KM106-2]|nr:chromosome (plasmid) partitioning protein ParB [Lachnospiraceae bacterium KM106-2]
MVTKRGLGKGLDSMIPNMMESKEKKNPENNIEVNSETLVDINKVEPNKDQPRKNFDEDALLELADSIKQYGVIQPLVVHKKEKTFEIIAGERRWRAARLAGLKKVPVIVKEYTKQEIMEIALIENIQREDLNPIEEAIAYQRLIEEYHLKQDEVAERVAKSRTAITNSMRLLKLDKKVQEMLVEDMISSGHARALIPIDDGQKQYQVATQIFDHKLSVRETEKLVKTILEDKPSKEKTNKNQISERESILLKDIEEKMKKIIGTKVSINKKSKNKGKIEIEYYSDEDLERIIELFETMKHN